MEIQPRYLIALEACENIDELMKKARYFKKKSLLSVPLFDVVWARALKLIGATRVRKNALIWKKYSPKLMRLASMGWQESYPEKKEKSVTTPRKLTPRTLEQELTQLVALCKRQGGPVERVELSNLLEGFARAQDVSDLDKLAEALKRLKETLEEVSAVATM